MTIKRCSLKPSSGNHLQGEILETLDSITLPCHSIPNLFKILCFSVKTTETDAWVFTLADDPKTQRVFLYIHRLDRQSSEIISDQCIFLHKLMQSVRNNQIFYTDPSYAMDVFIDANLIG